MWFFFLLTALDVPRYRVAIRRSSWHRRRSGPDPGRRVARAGSVAFFLVKIPGRIIQTGKDRVLTPLANAAATNLKLLHPDWEYLYFDDEEIQRFVATEFPQYQAVFDRFPQAIQRIDFFRYLAVFRLGGFYFDLDVFLSKSLSPLLDHGCVFPFEELTLNRFLRDHTGWIGKLATTLLERPRGDPFL